MNIKKIKLWFFFFGGGGLNFKLQPKLDLVSSSFKILPAMILGLKMNFIEGKQGANLETNVDHIQCGKHFGGRKSG